MRQLFCIIVLTVPAYAVCSSPGRAEEDERGKSVYLEAERALDAGNYRTAASEYRVFLQDYPKSPRVPSALYKLASVLVLQRKAEEAQPVYEQLVREHFDSSWAQLVVRSVYPDQSLFDLANTKRKLARETDRPSDREAARELFEAYAERFPDHKRDKAEVLYKMGKLALARDQDKNNQWSKLAGFVLAGPTEFSTYCDELMELAEGEAEMQHALLELSRDAQGEQSGKVAFYRARCLEALDKHKEALAGYQKLCQAHPQSPFAAAAAFRLPEIAFARGEYQQARTGYLAMAKKYSASEYAATARRWADAIDQQDSAWNELEEILAGVLERFGAGQTGVAFRLNCETGKERKPLSVRMAFERQNLALDLVYGDAGLLIVSCRAGGWYRSGTRGPIHKLPNRLGLPVPCAVATAGHFSIGLQSNQSSGEGDPPTLHITREQLHEAIVKARVAGHLTRTAIPGKDTTGHKVYRVESAPWLKAQPIFIEFTVDAQGKVQSARMTLDWGKKRFSFSLSDVRLGERLADDVFAAFVPPKAEIIDGKDIDAFLVFSQLLQIVGMMTQDAGGAPEVKVTNGFGSSR